jgi:hypothetical protein
VEQAYLRRIYWKLTGAIMLVMLAALAAISYFSHQQFERHLVPEMAKKATTVGTSVNALIAKATSYGIEYRQLYGVEQSFAEVRTETPDFTYIAATDEDGKILWEAGTRGRGTSEYAASAPVLRALSQPAGTLQPVLISGNYLVSMPIAVEGKPLGMLHIGIAQKFIQNIMLEVLLDVLVVLIVAMFFTLELLNFLAGAPLAAGLRDFAATITRVKGGDFGGRVEARGQDEIGRILGLIDAAIVRLNKTQSANACARRTRHGPRCSRNSASVPVPPPRSRTWARCRASGRRCSPSSSPRSFRAPSCPPS